MYERFYQLRERPFSLSPDPEYLYPSRVHQEALSYLRYGLESHAGFIVITGEIGSGKTTLVQALLRNLDSHTTVARIVNTMLEPRELIETIMIDFGLDPAGRSKPLLLRDLSQYLVDQRMAGRLVLLAIDEAQNLSPGALEELRMLSNLETEKSKLLQIVLVGQPNLREKLATPELEQLRQRITVSYHLPPLDAEETWRYVNHRLRRAAVGAPLEFPRAATDRVHGRSRGVPRLINVICDATLVFGYAEERRQIDGGLVDDVLAELEMTGVLPRPARSADDPRPETPLGSEREPAPVLAQSADDGMPVGSVGRVLDARHWPPTTVRMAADESARAAALDSREQALRQRELELQEQRRVLAEEYRLLRVQRPLTHGIAVPAIAGGVRYRVPSTTPLRSARSPAASPRNFWARVRRVMLGAS